MSLEVIQKGSKAKSDNPGARVAESICGQIQAVDQLGIESDGNGLGFGHNP
jgi:hypothetical protein